MGTLTKQKVRSSLRFPDDLNGSGGNGGDGREGALPSQTAQIGLWALLATISMLFAGFTSAYILRRTGSDWRPIAMPGLLYLNTALLLLSSVTMEAARASAKRRRSSAIRRWLLITTALGVAFLCGQFFAWKHLVAQGVYLPSSPHSSFFYMLTGVHGLHLLGGIIALLYVLRQAWRSYQPSRWSALTLCATYWHFVDGLWIYLFVMLFLW